MSNAPFYSSNLVTHSTLSGGGTPLVHPPSSERFEFPQSSFSPSFHHQPPMPRQLPLANPFALHVRNGQASGLNFNIQGNLRGSTTSQETLPGTMPSLSMPSPDARPYLPTPPLNPYQLSLLPLVEDGHLPLDASIATPFWHQLREKVQRLSRVTTPDFFGETLVAGAMSLVNHAKDQVVVPEELNFILEFLHTLFLRTTPNVDPISPAASVRINERIELWRSILRCFHRMFAHNISMAMGEHVAHINQPPNLHRPPDMTLAGPMRVEPGPQHCSRRPRPMAPPIPPPQQPPPILQAASRLLSNLKNLPPSSSG